MTVTKLSSNGPMNVASDNGSRRSWKASEAASAQERVGPSINRAYSV